MKLEDVVLGHIFETLERNSYNRNKTCKELGISPKTLRYKLDKLTREEFYTYGGIRGLGFYQKYHDAKQPGRKLSTKEIAEEIEYKNKDNLKIFPTNDERVEYRDEMINRNFLES